jgi:hypothetical protein
MTWQPNRSGNQITLGNQITFNLPFPAELSSLRPLHHLQPIPLFGFVRRFDSAPVVRMRLLPSVAVTQYFSDYGALRRKA